MPVVPGALIELAGFRSAQNVAKVPFTDGVDHADHVIPVANVHNPCGDAMRKSDGLIRRFPPDVGASEGAQAGEGLLIERRY